MWHIMLGINCNTAVVFYIHCAEGVKGESLWLRRNVTIHDDGQEFRCLLKEGEDSQKIRLSKSCNGSSESQSLGSNNGGEIYCLQDPFVSEASGWPLWETRHLIRSCKALLMSLKWAFEGYLPQSIEKSQRNRRFISRQCLCWEERCLGLEGRVVRWDLQLRHQPQPQ